MRNTTMPRFTLQVDVMLLEVYDDSIVVRPNGTLGRTMAKPTRILPFSSIVSIDFTEAHSSQHNGSLVLATLIDITDLPLWEAQNETASEIVAFLHPRIGGTYSHAPPAMSMSEELAKLGYLRKRGILSEPEFVAAKDRIIGTSKR